MRFPYVELRGKRAPIVPVKFKIKKEWIEFKAYVDSGAGYSIFHSSITEILGIRLEEGEKIYITVGDGSQIVVYLHKIIVRLAGEEFKTTIGFSRYLGIGFNVIGRFDIFDRFKICFDEIEEFVEFSSKKFKER